MPGYTIRRSRPADIPALMEIERDAAQLFRTVGYDFCADGPVRDEAEHRYGMSNGAHFTVEAPDGAPAGFILLWRLDGRAHVTELSVATAHQGKGLGRRLLAHAEEWARGQGYTGITLTTFRDVPWNMPFYERCGYAVFEPGPDRPDLRAVTEEETGAGFAAKPRVAMRKSL
ncbi:MAG: GNAT family N-acetyltransferase [Alphaproteobacteria bacterium]